ncbi:hypothetical protein BgiMline_036911 [Biomphalaria glabrata]|nr:hypothetical protein BgiMline_015287 [Biomphalaria glabrata]
MLIVEIKQNKIKTSIPCIEKTKESSRSDKLFLEAKDHILQLDKKGETEEFKDAWESFRLSFKNHLGKIVDKNEDTIWFRLRHVEEVREVLSKKSLSDQKSTELYDTTISDLSKCLCLIDDGSRNEDNDNVSIFNDNFTDEINESADVTCNFREISRRQIKEAITFVMKNSVTNSSILSVNRKDLKNIFQDEEFVKLFELCWTQEIIPTEILFADVFSSHVTPAYNAIYVFSLFSEIFQYCIYRKLRFCIKQNEPAHGFLMTFSQRELYYYVNQVRCRSLAMNEPMYIAVLDLSRISMALDAGVIIEHLEKQEKEKKDISKNVVQLLKSFLVKSIIYAKVDKTNDKSDFHKIAMQFVWSCFLTECFTKRDSNRGIKIITTLVGNALPIMGFVFVDVVIFLAHSKEEIENSLSCLSEFLRNKAFDYEELDITVSTNKTCDPHDESNVLNCFGEKIKLSPSINLLGTSFGFCKE